jgi:hypothetical protein
VALVRNEVSDVRNASIIRVTEISELRTTLAVTSNRRTLRRNTSNNVSSNYQQTHAAKKCYVYIVFLRSVRLLKVTANVVPSSLILVTLCSYETSVPTRATRHNIPEDGILHSLHCENFKSYTII